MVTVYPVAPGAVYSNEATVSVTSTSTSGDSLKVGAQVTLPAGTYIVTGQFTLGSASNTTGNRKTAISLGNDTTRDLYGMIATQQYNSAHCIMRIVSIVELTAETKVRVHGGASVVPSGTCVTSIDAVRIA